MMKEKKIFRMLAFMIICVLFACIGVVNVKVEAKNKSAKCYVSNYKSIEKAKKDFNKDYKAICNVDFYEIYLNTKFGKKKATLCSAKGSAGNFLFYFKHKNKIYKLDFSGLNIYGMSKNGKYILTGISACEHSVWRFSKGVWKEQEANYEDSSGAWVKSMKKKYSIQDIEKCIISKKKSSSEKAYIMGLYDIKSYSIKNGKIKFVSNKIYYSEKNNNVLGEVKLSGKKSIGYKLSSKCKYQQEDPETCKSYSRKKICKILDWAVKPKNKTRALKEDSPPSITIYVKNGVVSRVVYFHS